MSNKVYSDYLNSKEWAEIRIELFTVRGKKCERCSSKKKLHVHHKHYKNIFHEEPEDLEILCSKCHEKEHKKPKPKVKIKTKQFLPKKKIKVKGRYKLFKNSELKKRVKNNQLKHEQRINKIREEYFKNKSPNTQTT